MRSRVYSLSEWLLVHVLAVYACWARVLMVAGFPFPVLPMR